jgi:hypothetical protein
LENWRNRKTLPPQDARYATDIGIALNRSRHPKRVQPVAAIDRDLAGRGGIALLIATSDSPCYCHLTSVKNMPRSRY